MQRKGIGDIVPLYVQPGPDGNLPTGLPANLQGPPVILAPALQAFLQGYIATQQGAAASDPTALTSPAYGVPGAGEPSNVYGANGPFVDDVYSSLIQQGLFTGTNPAQVIGRKNAPAPAGGFFERPTIIPDSKLPGPLKRQSQLTNRILFAPNRYDQAIQREMKRWQWIAEHGGLKSCCRIPELGAPIWDQPPWMVMPSQGQVIQELFNQPTSNFLFNGVDQVLGKIRVPIGYDGVINKVVVSFTGSGFDDGSGNLIWRVKAGERFLRNLGNIDQTYGSFQNAWAVPLSGNRVVSGQYITVYVNIPVLSPISGGVIQAGLFGWFYPRR